MLFLLDYYNSSGILFALFSLSLLPAKKSSSTCTLFNKFNGGAIMKIPSYRINYNDLLLSLSKILDLTCAGLTPHHERVAFIASRLAEPMGLDNAERQKLLYASLVHDIGAVSELRETARLKAFDYEDTYKHCERGYQLLKGVPLGEDIAEIILSHHDKWEGENKTGLSGESIPPCSRLIYLADRVEISIKEGQNILDQVEGIVSYIDKHTKGYFMPEAVECLKEIAEEEALWLTLTSGAIKEAIHEQLGLLVKTIEIDDLISLGHVYAKLVDDKSKFTYRHSTKVSIASYELAKRLGLCELELKQTQLAGLLHDVGKLFVPEEIIEKPFGLSPLEFNYIKAHPYYTQYVLTPVPDFQNTVIPWASQHHESLDGKGYPFHLDSRSLSLGSRMLCISDVFIALTEDRPYRKALPKERVIDILKGKVESKKLDGDIANLLCRDFDDIYAKVYDEDGP